MTDCTHTESRIEAIQYAYRLGYLAQEARVTYRKDVKMTVGSIAVDAKEGDMSSLQRWVAKILAEQGAVEIQSRSEEHTSELQSRFDLVCRLLLEKKKNTN